MAGPVVVLGGGSAGEAFVAALRRIDADVRITLVERGLVGGECSYYACMPSKALLRPAEVLAAARLAPGAAEAITGALDPSGVFWHRDQVTGSWDDSSQETWVKDLDVELVRGEGRVTQPGIVTVDGRELHYETLVIATGSSPLVPEVDGLADVPFWTSPDATSTNEIPESILVLGGGPVGCELAQFFARMGSRVTLVNTAERLLPRLDEEAGALLADSFRNDGIDLRLGAAVERVEPGIRVHFSDGELVEAERLLVATGRKPNVEGFGLELLDLTITRRGIEVDDMLRAADNVWVLGDTNGIAPFTHVGKYQARVAAANVGGRIARADYRAIPAVTFTDPQIASAGQTDGEGLVSSSWRIDRTARSSTYERPKRPGFVKVFADPERQVLVGAVAVGPEAGEWLGQLTLAIRAEVPVAVLRDTIQPYPTFSEALFFAIRDLPF